MSLLGAKLSTGSVQYTLSQERNAEVHTNCTLISTHRHTHTQQTHIHTRTRTHTFARSNIEMLFPSSEGPSFNRFGCRVEAGGKQADSASAPASLYHAETPRPLARFKWCARASQGVFSSYTMAVLGRGGGGTSWGMQSEGVGVPGGPNLDT